MAEDDQSRLDRELIELLNELRVALPGVQMLFAFLLTVPFTQRFPDISQPQKLVYFASFLCAALSTAFFIAPTAFHRIQFRERDKEYVVNVSNRLALVGTFFLAGAMCCVVFVITDVLFEVFWGPLMTALAAGVFGWLWFGMPLLRRLRT